MATSDDRVARWMGVLCDLVAEPTSQLEVELLSTELRATFHVTTVTWQWRDTSASFGFRADPLPASLDDDFWVTQSDPSLLDAHPLLRWYRTTADPRPQTVRRVPHDIAPLSCIARSDSLHKPLGCEQQLSIPYRLGGVGYRAFMLSRPGSDFSDADLVLAEQIQRVVRALDAQARHVAALGPWAEPDAEARHVLTAREMVVLNLLSRGLTAAAIARRLSISRRTVHKHLEHSYRKLRVDNGISAVLVARRLGMGSTPPGVGRWC